MKKQTTVKLFGLCMVFALMLTGCGGDYEDDYDDEYEDDYGYDDEYEDEYGYDDEYEDDGYEDDYGYDDSEQDRDQETTKPANANLDGSKFALGTCGELEGTTLLVSIFLDDATNTWAGNEAVIDDCLAYTKIAADWISKSAAGYNCNSKFIYDWKQNSDLSYEGSVGVDMIAADDDSESVDNAAWQFIDANVDSQALLTKYNADNIAYLFFINTPKSNSLTSCTRNYYEGMEYPYEMCYMYMFCEDEEETPAAIAHEILHTFGAPDLYAADSDGENYGIPQQLVDELEANNSNDIMYTTYDATQDIPRYDRITNDFTDVDAYYVGLTDSCDFVDEWNLNPSQHR